MVLKRYRMTRSDPLDDALGKQTLWEQDQRPQQHDIGGDILESGRQIKSGELFGNSDSHAPNQGAWDAAKPAEYRGRKHLDAEEAHIDIDQRHRRKQDRGSSRDTGADRPDQREDRAHWDAHIIGGELILRGRLHGHAKPRAVEEQVEDGAQQHRAANDRQAVVTKHEAMNAY